jgi:DNA-binding SARP family transcriptional activator
LNRLQIRLLGGFEARLGDQLVRGFESRKARALLGYLAYNRKDSMRRDHRASLFWGERSEE